MIEQHEREVTGIDWSKPAHEPRKLSHLQPGWDEIPEAHRRALIDHLSHPLASCAAGCAKVKDGIDEADALNHLKEINASFQYTVEHKRAALSYLGSLWLDYAVDMPKPDPALEALANRLYSTYCEAVGGVAWNGDKLPTWEEFSADPSKQKQVLAWLETAKASYTTSGSPWFNSELSELVLRLMRIAERNDDEFRCEVRIDVRNGAQKPSYKFVCLELADHHEWLTGRGATPEEAARNAASQLDAACKAHNYNLPDE